MPTSHRSVLKAITVPHLLVCVLPVKGPVITRSDKGIEFNEKKEMQYDSSEFNRETLGHIVGVLKGIAWTSPVD